MSLVPKVLVGGEGPLECKIAFIGEAPGAQEARLGRPFVGPAGQLFNEVLRSAGISRSACYITNVIKEKPTKNDIKAFINLSKKSNPSTPSYERYVELLRRELIECTANVLVPLGNIPLYALTGMKKILKRRGSILESTLLPGRKVIPTIHPSAALRQYVYRHLIIYDLSKISKESEIPELNLPERELVVQPSLSESLKFLEICSVQDMIGFDIEVANEEVSCISFSYKEDLSMSIPFTEGGSEYFTLEQEALIWRKIASILENKKIVKVGQNVIFDSTFLFRKLGIRSAPLQDTMVGQAILFPDLPKGLDFITSIYTREPYYKDEGKRRFKGLGGNDKDFWKYNAKDSVVLMEAFPKIYRDLKKQGNIDTYHHQVQIIEPLMYMSERGIRMDIDSLHKASEEAGREIEELTEQVSKMTDGYILNPNSTKQLKDYFYVKRGIKPYVKRSTGRPTVDETALKRLARKGEPVAKPLLDIRRLVKLKGTYLDVKLDKDNRLRCSYNPVGATTGRLSSSKTIFGTGTNLQNQPPEMKRLMLADKGYVAYSMDLAQAENRVVSYIGPVPLMISAFENNVDIHSQTAGLILGKPTAEVSNELGSSSFGNGRESERFWGKKANHGLNYGLGYKTFALLYELQEKEARIIVERYHAAYPGVRQYHSWIRELLAKGRILKNCFGRRRTFMDRWGEGMFKDAYSFIPQSTIADKINRHGLVFAYSLPSVEILNQVHDAIVFQVPINIGWKSHAGILLSIKEMLERPITWRNTSFSIPIECEMGLNLKDMEEVDLAGDAKQLSISLEKTYERVEE